MALLFLMCQDITDIQLVLKEEMTEIRKNPKCGDFIKVLALLFLMCQDITDTQLVLKEEMTEIRNESHKT